jgi:hypothetical protein
MYTRQGYSLPVDSPLPSCLRTTTSAPTHKSVSFDAPEDWNVHEVRPFLYTSPAWEVLRADDSQVTLIQPKDGASHFEWVMDPEATYQLRGNFEYRIPRPMPELDVDFSATPTIPYRCEKCAQGHHLCFDRQVRLGKHVWQLTERQLWSIEYEIDQKYPSHTGR